jgi:hypothetical protein
MKTDLFGKVVLLGGENVIRFTVANHRSCAHPSLNTATSFWKGVYAAKYSSRCHFDRGLAAGNAMPWSEKRALFGEMEPG